MDTITAAQKLDNPVWYLLTEVHQYFAIEYGGIKFYAPNYCPFGGFIALDETLIACDQYSALIDNFYIIGDRPNFNE
jgi:hypothetical protein